MNKKVLIAAVFLSVSSVSGLFAKNPEVFAFSITVLPHYDFPAKKLNAGYGIGLDVTMNDTFTGGFEFVGAATSVALLKFAVAPADRLRLNTYVGAKGNDIAFGIGVGVQTFSRERTEGSLFSSFNVEVRWLAASNDTGSMAAKDGGALFIGISAQVGI